MAEYRKIDWKVQRVGNQLYIHDNVVRKPKFEENPEIEHGHKRQGDLNRQRRKNKEFAQTMNRRYICFLLVSAVVVFASAAMYLQQISKTTVVKGQIEDLESKVNSLKIDNDEVQSRMDSSINVEEIRRIAMEELGMVFAGRDQVIKYQYEESDYVNQYQEIPKK